MSAKPRLRKFALTAHIVASVGWLGSIVVFLALSIVGLTSQDASVVRAAYVAMESVGWVVLVPLSIASLLTGIVQSVGTKWGLFVHYWVLVKLVINIVATIVLLLYMQSLSYLAGVAAQPPSAGSDLHGLRSPSPLLHAGAALLLLLVAAVLSVYKPAGMTRYGQRKQRARRAMPS